MVGQPAAEHGTEHRPDHDRNAEHRHRLAALLYRVDVEQDTLRQRHQRRPEEALQQPKADDLQQRLGKAAQHRRHDEAGDGNEQDALAPETVGQVARWRRHHGGGHDIGGQHPVDLVRTRRNAALDIGQRDVGDGGVQRLHDDRQDHAGGDRPAMRNGERRAGGGCASHSSCRNGRSGPERTWAGRAHGRCRHRPRRSFHPSVAACRRRPRWSRAWECAARP